MEKNNTLIEAKRLHDLGFAIMPLHPKSKRPKMSGWTTGPRLEWPEFLKQFTLGDNVGVRLGEASPIGENFLACVDIDIHEESFKVKAEKLIKTLFNGTYDTCPQVLSGSGKGSKHLYCVTKTPFKMITLLKEKAGEICVYSTGRQMVLPPSIHEVSGDPYKWGTNLLKSKDLPLMAFESVNVMAPSRNMISDWKPELVDLAFSELDSAIIDIILFADVDDKSAALFKVAIAMVKTGFTDHQIMSVLTDQNYELGKAAFDHAKTESRAKAASWIFNYTIKKARFEADARMIFDRDVIEEKDLPLMGDEVEAQLDSLLIQPATWEQSLDATKGGKTTATLNNALLILENTLGKGIFKRDIFALKDKYGKDTPWGGKLNEDIKDADILKMKVWFIRAHHIEASDKIMGDAVGFIALENAYHPVRDYLDSLEWDGRPRLDTWLKTYLRAEAPEPYLSSVSRKTLCAMVARIYQPGIKFDHVLIMNGKQGIGKSSAARILASPQWFMDRLPDLRDKDSMINLQGIWVVEMGELANMRASSAETYKAFLSSQVDKFRLPYGNRREDFARQCIIIGSANPTEFLNDPTGNRRFWPVKVKQCDFTSLARDRDQLLAEAKWVWQNCGETLYLDSLEEKQAIEVQQTHTADDTDAYLEDHLDEYLFDEKKAGKDSLNLFKLETLFDNGQVFSHLIYSKDNRRVAKLLRKKGFEIKRTNEGRNRWQRNVGFREGHQNE